MKKANRTKEKEQNTVIEAENERSSAKGGENLCKTYCNVHIHDMWKCRNALFKMSDYRFKSDGRRITSSGAIFCNPRILGSLRPMNAFAASYEHEPPRLSLATLLI